MAITKTTKIVIGSVMGLIVIVAGYFGYKAYTKANGTGTGTGTTPTQTPYTPYKPKATGSEYLAIGAKFL
jgi:hypothetical protein